MDRDEIESPTPPPRWREVFQGPRGRLITGLLILEALMAVEALVVITIMPAINREFGAVHLYGWAFAAFSLATFGSIPVSGRAADRYGVRPVLGTALAIYLGGLVVAASAPGMLVLLLGRFLQGVGAGGLYAVSLGAVAKTFPSRLRARVLALLASMWVLPGLFGPPFGALLASTVGWRWAFVAPIPILAGSAALVFPAISSAAIPRTDGVAAERIPVRWPVQLMVGAGLFLAALTDASVRALPLAVIGLAIGLPALARIVPEGLFTARPGLPAAGATAFLLSASFFAVDGFVPLMLTETRGMSLARASVVVTLATVTWALGSWWQSRRANRVLPGRLVGIGAVLILAGTLAVASGLLEVPILAVYVGWAVAGFGMGIAFPTIPLAVMNVAGEGAEAGDLSSVLLMDMLGVGLGAGLGGASIAIAESLEASLERGLGGAFAVALAATAVLLVVARRLPVGPARDEG
jgi:MFS family permease